MRLALEEAKKAKAIDEVPIGAVIVKDGEVIASGFNMKEHLNQANAHAEFLAMMEAEKKLNTWCLDECDLYVTLEPCMMCTGMLQQSRIRRLYYGTSDPKGGTVESLVHIKSIPRLNVYPKEIYTGILQDECAQILKDFFREKREQKKLENKS